MGRLIVSVVVVVVAVAILLPQTLFTVDETELAIVTRFGAFQRDYRTPGLFVKQPFVETVVKMDSRLLRVDSPPASLLTSDKRNLVIDSYSRYRITDPLLFFQRLRTEGEANLRVQDIVGTQLRREVALDTQSEVISETREQVMRRVADASNRSEITGPRALELSGNNLRAPGITVLITPAVGEGTTVRRARFATVEQIAELERMGAPALLNGDTVAYYRPLREELGIDIVDVRIKRADFPSTIEDSVYARMRAERAEIASGLRAEGTQRDREIRAEVDRDVQIILEQANGTSAKLRGEAEEEAIRILAEALEQDPEFYAFRRSLEAYANIIDDQTLVVLESDSPLFRYLQQQGVVAQESDTDTDVNEDDDAE